MNDVKFTLKDPNAKSKSLIFAVFHLGNGQRIKLSTGISIPPDMWNNRKKCIKPGYTHQFELNKKLNDFTLEIQNLFLKIEKENGKGNIEAAAFKEILKRNAADGDLSVLNIIDIYKKFLVKKSKLIGSESIKTFNTTLRHLMDYEKLTKKTLFIADLNTSFYNDYCGFCFAKLGLAPNTVGRDIKNLKVFINFLRDIGIGKNIDTSKFKGISVPSFSVALAESELKKIYDLDLSDNQKLHQVRIKFLLACYTGMRISDLFRFGPGNVKEDMIEYNQRKTGETVFLPRHDELNKILKMLEPDYKITKISEQKYNEYLKELCQLAGIDDEIKVPVYEGRNKVFKNKRKYELISSHTGRKTFASIGITKGIPAEALMKFTGHKDLSVFLKYVKMPPNVYMDLIKKAWSK